SLTVYATICYSLSHHSPIPAFYFFNDTATSEIYTLSLHDALPILAVLVAAAHHERVAEPVALEGKRNHVQVMIGVHEQHLNVVRSEEHTSELQSRGQLVCRLLLEKKKYARSYPPSTNIICNCTCSI